MSSAIHNPDFDPLYLSAIDELYHYGWATGKLLRIRLLKKSIVHLWPQGHPTQLIHVTGTNGKGSTCRLLEAALGTCGQAGAWVNPHLFDYAERFSLNSGPVSHEDIARIWRDTIREHSLDRAEHNADHALSFAEAGLLIALQLFHERQVQWAAVEVGVGGRYAPSMAIDPALCILTNVGRDHPRTLGEQGWQIALEKAGIARPGVPLLTSAAGEDLQYVVKTAEAEGAELQVVADRDVHELESTLASLRADARITGDFSPGRHWLSNAALALAAASLLQPSLDRERALLAMINTPLLAGRCWLVNENLLADVAHNQDKLQAFAQELKLRWPTRPIRLVFGLSRNRPLHPLIDPLLEHCAALTFTSAGYAGRDPEELRKEFCSPRADLTAEVNPNPVEAVQKALAERKAKELVVLTGSAYTIDQALNDNPYLRTMNREFGRRGTDGGGPEQQRTRV